MCSGSRPHSETSWPMRARWIARAVPQLPAPRTVTAAPMPGGAGRSHDPPPGARELYVVRRRTVAPVLRLGRRLRLGLGSAGVVLAVGLLVPLGQARDGCHPLALLE